MPWKRNHRERKSLRLKGWDYRSSAWYFLTVVTKNRRHFFGKIQGGIIGLSEIGGVAYRNWAAIPDHFDHVVLDEFVIMPNHVHGLVGIMEWPGMGCEISHPNRMRLSHDETESGRRFGPLKSGSISVIMHSYKASVSRWARKNDNYEFGWQSRFHDHIVRNKGEKERIKYYIKNNPRAWDEDRS